MDEFLIQRVSEIGRFVDVSFLINLQVSDISNEVSTV
jgi:hypothetical protein